MKMRKNSKPFVLMENWHLESLQGYPELGTGVLLGALKAQKVPTRFLPGQTAILEGMFLAHIEEIFSLIKQLDDQEHENAGLTPEIRSIDKAVFVEKMRTLYTSCIINKNPRIYLHQVYYQELLDWYRIFQKLQLFYLTEKGHQDIPILRPYKKAIKAMSPVAVGVFLTHGPRTFTFELMRFCQSNEIPVVVGGSWFVFLQERSYASFLTQRFIDFMVVGPGERALPQLIHALDAGEDVGSIPNLVYQQDGKVIVNPKAPISDLDSFPDPCFDGHAIEKYASPVPVLPFEASRGCQWGRCAFCSQYKVTPGYHTYSVERVLDRLEKHIEQYGVTHYMFSDDHIVPAAALKIAEGVLERELNVHFYALARLEKGFNDANTLSTLARGGFRILHWGLESASQRMIDRMRKGFRIADAETILEKAARAGLDSNLFVIMGFPGETEEEVEKTLAFLRQHRENYLLFEYNHYILRANTFVYDQPWLWDVVLSEDVDRGDLADKHPALAFETKTGMSSRQSEKRFAVIKRRKDFGDMSDPNSINVMEQGDLGLIHLNYYFLLSSHQFIRFDEAHHRLDEGHLNELFPIISGMIRRDEDQLYLQPINLSQPLTLYALKQPSLYPLTDLEVQVFELSIGNLSIQQIMDRISSRPEHQEDAVRTKVLAFFRLVLEKHWGALFGKRWLVS